MHIQSLKNKIILLFLGTILSLYVLTAIILLVVSLRIFEQQMDDSMDSVASAVNNNIDILNKEINGIATRFSLNASVRILLKASNTQPGSPLIATVKVDDISTAISYAESERLTKNYVQSITLYDRHYQEITTIGSYDANIHYTQEYMEYISRMLVQAQSSVFIHMYTGLEESPDPSQAALEVYTPLYDLATLSPLGYLRLVYDPTAVFNNYRDTNLNPVLTFLAKDDGNFVYHPKIVSCKNEFDNLYQQTVGNNRPFNARLEKGRFRVSRYHCSIPERYLVIAYPFNDVEHKMVGIYVQIMAVIIFFLTVLFVLFNRALRRILKPVQQLTRIVSAAAPENKFAARELEAFVSTLPTCDEVSRLSHSFCEMTRRINDSILRLETSYLQKQELELRLLQSQINPHFLYNSIDSICGLACLKSYDEIYSMAKNLGNFYKLSLKKGKIYTDVASELQHVESYLKIEQIRCSHSFLYTIKCPPECMNETIIKIILQPIAENAVLHGIRGYSKQGYIHITCRAEDGFLVFQVFNNGFPLDPKMAESVNSGFADNNGSFGFGIRNVYQRLQLYYKGAASIHYSVNDGTLVTIKIPVTASSVFSSPDSLPHTFESSFQSKGCCTGNGSSCTIQPGPDPSSPGQ